MAVGEIKSVYVTMESFGGGQYREVLGASFSVLAARSRLMTFVRNLVLKPVYFTGLSMEELLMKQSRDEWQVDEIRFSDDRLFAVFGQTRWRIEEIPLEADLKYRK